MAEESSQRYFGTGFDLFVERVDGTDSIAFASSAGTVLTDAVIRRRVTHPKRRSAGFKTEVYLGSSR
jgi:hypothetical protein